MSTLSAGIDNSDTSSTSNTNKNSDSETSAKQTSDTTTTSDTKNNSGNNSATSGASSLANSLLTGGQTSNSGSNSQSINSLIDTITNSFTSGSTKGSQNINETTASNPFDLATARGLIGRASGAADNYLTDTSNLVSGILNKAAIAFGPTLASGANNGIYGSSTLQLLQGNAMGQAVADAANSVLAYKTTEENLAGSLSDSVLKASKTTTGTTTNESSNTSQTTSSSHQASSQDTVGATRSDSQNYGQTFGNQYGNTTGATNTNAFSNTTLNQVVSAIQNLLSTTQSHSNENTTGNSSTTKESANLGISIVCTALSSAKLLSDHDWYAGTKHFEKYPPLVKASYYVWGRPLAKYVSRHPKSTVAKLLAKFFTARTHFIYGELSLFGALATFAIFLTTLVCGLGLLCARATRKLHHA